MHCHILNRNKLWEVLSSVCQCDPGFFIIIIFMYLFAFAFVIAYYTGTVQICCLLL